MSCHDAREWLSDLLDDALEADARAHVEAHLAGCAECMRELDRLRATVSLLAPSNGRRPRPASSTSCLEAARPTPWHRRLLDWLAASGSSDFPSRAAAWCSWPRSPSTSFRKRPR
jgi:anti-sigma factor RsiW